MISLLTISLVPSSLRQTRSWLVLVMLAMTCTGCRQVGERMSLGKSDFSWNQVELVYELPALQQESASRAFSSEATVAAHQENLPEKNWSSASLRILYPHPEGLENMARCKLRLNKQPPPTIRPVSVSAPQSSVGQPLDWLQNEQFAAFRSPVTHDEIWILDLPVNELRDILEELTTVGFFDAPAPQSALYGQHIDLAVAIDGERTHRAWQPNPVLDALIAEVHQRGWLCTFCSAETSLAQ